MLQNESNCTIQFFFLGDACPRSPLANAWLRHASQAASPCNSPSLQKSWPPLENRECAPGLLLSNLFEEMRS